MRLLRAEELRSIHDLTGVYGRGPFTTGIISEHVDLALRAGFTLHTGVDGDYLKDAEGDTALVLCSELIEVVTEDGRESGRCGIPVIPDQWACEGHWFDMDALCEHGMAAALCQGPQHY
jgi:hypothetical protein